MQESEDQQESVSFHDGKGVSFGVDGMDHRKSLAASYLATSAWSSCCDSVFDDLFQTFRSALDHRISMLHLTIRSVGHFRYITLGRRLSLSLGAGRSCSPQGDHRVLLRAPCGEQHPDHKGAMLSADSFTMDGTLLGLH